MSCTVRIYYHQARINPTDFDPGVYRNRYGDGLVVLGTWFITTWGMIEVTE